MRIYRMTLWTMKLVILVCQLGLILRTEAQIPEQCRLSETNRPPENEDITVVCGTEYMDLSIYLCPVYQALFNESLMVLNNANTNPECFGTADWNVDPPVLRFRFDLNESSITSCGNSFKIIDVVGSGDFSDFSSVQKVNISGTITSIDPSTGMITYHSLVLYKFSCLYPLQYLLNNTQIAVSGVNLAIRDNNGSFISTLNMTLYEDESHTRILTMPASGLPLKRKIYVAVMASNLTERFNVLLDRCYATTSPYPAQSKSYDLFVGCERDLQTKVELNGVSQKAYFSFEAFRFVEHNDQTLSVFYLHCTTRLCEVSSCNKFVPNCDSNGKRRKREAEEVSGNATVTSTPIRVGRQKIEDATTLSASHSSSPGSSYSGPVVAVIICIIVLAILLSAMGVYFMLYIRRTKHSRQ